MYCTLVGADITQEGSSKVPTIIVGSFVSIMRDLRRTVIGQLSKSCFVTVELFSTFFNARCGRKKRQERRLKNAGGVFQKRSAT